MAIIKAKQNNQGVNFEYWIAYPELDPITKKTNVSVLGFINKAARDAGFYPVEKLSVGTIEGVYNDGTTVYNYIKASKPATANSLKEDGTIEEVTVETNWFVDAVDA